MFFPPGFPLTRLIPAALVLLPVTLSLPAAAAPQQIQATYDVYRNGVRLGESIITLNVTGTRYVLQSETKPVGLARLMLGQRGQLRVKSEGSVSARGLHPEQFNSVPGKDSHKAATARLDWQKGQLVSIHAGQARAHKLLPGTQDKLSLLYHYMFTAPPRGTFSVPVASGKKYETERMQASHENGTPSLLKLANVRDETGEARLEIWLDPARDYLPVKIVHDDTADRERTEQVLRQVQATPD